MLCYNRALEDAPGLASGSTLAIRCTQHNGVVKDMLPVSALDSAKSPFHKVFLARLARLLDLEVEWRDRPSAASWRLRLIQKGIYSTYCDCLSEGFGAQAQDLIERHRVPDPS